eukprot:TRINITY_DN4180_c0_g1_i1.p1 TRINITY_DN4180_c0_g1~~TRINITY_DN4180_c0_g1_i1.p1  ORF type:complete len:206 (-),score=43.06 TRINITY_DN4180_c0_g1_i1:32-619(-)
MFAVLVAGRLVQTQHTQVSPTQIVFNLDDVTDIHHVVVFLTGSSPLPEGTGALIYLGWPPFEDFGCIGYLTNEKPSAIFKVSQQHCGVGGGTSFNGTIPGQNTVAQIGIEIQELKGIEHQFGTIQEQKQNEAMLHVNFSQKMVTSLYNYTSSFMIDVTDNMTGQSEKYVPVSAFDNWYNRFEEKLSIDPNFWKNL